MTDLTVFEALIHRLVKIDLVQSSEQATREIVVNPIIGALGWDTFNPHEVAREYSVLGGRVDYCLRTKKKNLVLIEVKRTGTDLVDHQEQLLRYAFDEGIPLAVLTDGLVWWLYLSMAPENWLQRRFAEISFQEQKPAEAALKIHRFLNRDGLVNGSAIDEAKRKFESQKRDRLVRMAFQEAWLQILSDSQGLLPDLLAETVEEISGYQPDKSAITEFLHGVSGEMQGKPTTISESGEIPTMPLQGSTLSKGASKHSNLVRPKTPSVRPQAFWLDGERYTVTTWRNMLVQLCETLVSKTGPDFAELVVGLKGRKCPYFSLSSSELREPLQILGTDVFVEGNISAKQAEGIARQTLKRVRNSDNGFRIEI